MTIQYKAIFKGRDITRNNFQVFITDLTAFIKANPNDFGLPIEETQLGAWTRCDGETKWKAYELPALRALLKQCN